MRGQLSVMVVLVWAVSVVQAQCPDKCLCSVEDGDVLTNCSEAMMADIPRGGFHTETVSLDLCGNLIKILRNFTFLDRKLYTLETLDLSHNKYLSSIETNAFEAMTSLKYLDLSFDDLAGISTLVFKPFKKHLVVLNLSHNHYLELPNEGFQLPKLQELHLENCGLKALGANFFRDIKNIQLLNLRDNKLSTLDTPGIENMTFLKTLDLSNNMFQIVPNGMLTLPKSLSELSLSGNPWVCNCELKTLILSHEENPFVQNLTCDSPEVHRNQVFTRELAESLICETTTTTTTTTTTSDGDELRAVTDVAVNPFFLRRANLEMRRQELKETTRPPQHSPPAVVDIARAAVLQGTQDNWLENNQWWIICVCSVAFMTVVAIVLIKKVNNLRNRRSHEPVSLDEDTQ